MSPIPVVVHMTGLLMIVPPNTMGGGPTHVLMPRAAGLEPHVTEIGYPSETLAEHCEPARGDGICWVRMDGWSLDLGDLPSARSTLHSATLPREATNLSERFFRPVKHGNFGQQVAPRVRSRITLHSGRISMTCGIAKWGFRRPHSTNVDTLVLANVLEWTIPDAATDRLVLTRRKLRRWFLQPGKTETLEIPTTGRDILHLYIQHIPVSDALRPLAEPATPAHSSADESHTLAHERPAEHFVAMYDFLGIDRDEAPPLPDVILTGTTFITRYPPTGEPRPEERRGTRCPWIPDVSRNPGTLTCMVASGRTYP